MIIINSHTNEPYFNIATEEYIFHKFAEDILYLYVNSDSVVCGKHQNTMAEVDYLFAIKNNIPIIRRISGGGTVFHDLGNLNYCFINT
ncbi:MAG: lipoate--protein ligase family protein, partial [Bacteroidales bacterium]|nr:lipoate--protein ligase family protein [Bacteroidales bacterium]